MSEDTGYMMQLSTDYGSTTSCCRPHLQMRHPAIIAVSEDTGYMMQLSTDYGTTTNSCCRPHLQMRHPNDQRRV